MKVFILAAGLGTRLGNLTKEIPKPMIDINGTPFLEILVESFRNKNLKDLVFCVGYKSEVIKNHFGDGKRFGVKIEYSASSRPLGTAGEIKNASNLIEGRFIFVYGDTYIEFDYDAMLDFHERNDALVTILCTKSNAEGRSGGMSLEDCRVISFEEKVEKSFLSAGIFICEPEIKTLLDEMRGDTISFERDVLPNLLKDKKVFGFINDKEFIDIGVPESLERFRKNNNKMHMGGNATQ